MPDKQNTGSNVKIVRPSKLKRTKVFIDKGGKRHEGGAEAYFSANHEAKGKPSF